MAIEDPKKQRPPISRETKADENYIYIYSFAKRGKTIKCSILAREKRLEKK